MASHLSAAQLHGWEIAEAPARPWITAPRGSTSTTTPRCHLRWRDLDEESGLITSTVRTVIDCARELPFADALAVADSALRAGDVDQEVLAARAAQIRGKGAAQARRVAACASGLAANPFESVARALALDLGFDVSPQGAIEIRGVIVHPDLVDRDRRVVIECESWEWHGGRDAFDRDCWRYTALTAAGWTVFRFTWWQVMRGPDFVRSCLAPWVAGASAGPAT